MVLDMKNSLLVLILFGNLFAATLYVNNTASPTCALGTNFTTIQEAIDAASANDMIVVCNGGTYSENLIVNKTVSINAFEQGVVVNTSNSLLPVFNITATNVQISNFTIKDASAVSNNAAAIHVTGNNVNITENIITDNRYGIVVKTSSGIVTNNTIYTNTLYGIILDANSDSNTLELNIVYDNSYGILIFGSSLNLLNNNTVYSNSVDGISLQSSSSNNNLSFNSAYGNTQAGISIVDSSSNTLTSNNLSNNAEDGVWLSNGDSNTLSSNTAANNSNGFLLTSGSENNIFTSNLVNQNNQTAFNFQSSSNSNNLTLNNVLGSTNYGLYILNSIITVFSENNVSNASAYAILLNSSSLTFSANNGIYSIPSTGVDVYLDNSTLNTSSYNITTTYINFQVYSTNTSIKTVNLSNGNYVSATTILGVSTTSRKIVKNSLGYYYGLNVTNTSGSATFSPKLFYDSSDLSGYTTNYLGIGASSTAGIWTYYSATVNTTETSVYYTPIVSFSYFAPLAYSPYNPDEGEEKLFMNLSYEFNCSTGILEITAKDGPGIKGVNITIARISSEYSESKFSEENGKVQFIIESNGSYEMAAHKEGYFSESLTDLELELCKVEVGAECTLDTDCEDNEYCSNSECIEVQEECGYAQNHSWISYSCCSDNDCEEVYECINNNCVLKEGEELNVSIDENITDTNTSTDDSNEEGEEEHEKEEYDILPILIIILIILVIYYLNKKSKRKR